MEQRGTVNKQHVQDSFSSQGPVKELRRGSIQTMLIIKDQTHRVDKPRVVTMWIYFCFHTSTYIYVISPSTN